MYLIGKMPITAAAIHAYVVDMLVGSDLNRMLFFYCM